MIGIIGLGLAGSALYKRFLKMGLDVLGYDICSEALSQAELSGVKVFDSPEKIGLLSNTILLSLPDSKIVKIVVEGEMKELSPPRHLSRGETASIPCNKVNADTFGVKDFSTRIMI